LEVQLDKAENLREEMEETKMAKVVNKVKVLREVKLNLGKMKRYCLMHKQSSNTILLRRKIPK
jgi:hypothetical protein